MAAITADPLDLWTSAGAAQLNFAQFGHLLLWLLSWKKKFTSLNISQTGALSAPELQRSFALSGVVLDEVQRKWPLKDPPNMAVQ